MDSEKLMKKNSNNHSLQGLLGYLTVKVKVPVKNVEIVRNISGLALSSFQTQGFDRILKIIIKSLFFIKLEVNDDKTGLLFVPLSTLSKPEGTHHPLSYFFCLKRMTMFLEITCILANYIIFYVENNISLILSPKIRTVMIILLLKLM